MSSEKPPFIMKVAMRLGLVYGPGGEPSPGKPRRSRFGHVSSRLDEELDGLRARVAELERLIRQSQGH